MTAALVSLLTAALSIYGPAAQKEGVIVAKHKDFKEQVLDEAGVVAVQFYAPWCGHCKALKPAWKQATKELKGKVKLVVVDATVEASLAQKYDVRGYPTIKIFGDNKRKPTTYEGGRDASSLVRELKKVAKGGGAQQEAKPKARPSGSSTAEKERAKPEGGRPRGGANGGGAQQGFAATPAIELDDGNFKSLVLESDAPWLVAFYAPWCGHCKNLAPEWERAAAKLEGQFQFGALDATASQATASQYEVQGYPTIKYFHRGAAAPYEGPRDVDGLLQFALGKLESVGTEPEVPQLLSRELFDRKCHQKGMLCAIAFLPHILDTGAEGREALLASLRAAAKKNRRAPLTFLWSEGGQQAKLEESLGGFGAGYPALVAVSGEKARVAMMREAFDEMHISAFLAGVLRGGIKTQPVGRFGMVEACEAWDGKDGEMPQETPLDDYDDVEIDF